jgi:hypothetical protein
MHCADIADWYSTSPLWRPALPRPLRRFPPHLRPNFRFPAEQRPPDYRSATVRFDWLSDVKTDFVWRFANPAIASLPPPAPWTLPANEPAEATPSASPARNRSFSWLQLVLLGTLCALSAKTVGQELEGFLPAGLPIVASPSSVTILARPRPDFDSPGITAGTFTLHPSWSEGLGFDSNPLAGSGQAGSAFASTQASVSVVSDWLRNSLGASVSVDDRRYLQLHQLSRTDDTISAGGRYDVGTADHLVLSATHADLHIEPTGIDAISTQQGVPYQVNTITASYLWNLSRLSFEPFAIVSDTTYSSIRTNGVLQSNTYLDNTTFTEGVTTRYQLSPLRNAVFVVRSSESDFSHTLAGSPRRNSVSVSVLGGLDYVADGIWRYRALAGYQIRDYSASSYKSHAAPIVEADVIWSPSVLTTVEANLNRRIIDSNDPTVADYTDTAAKLQVEQEVRRDVLASAHVSYEQALFQNGAGQQTILGAGAGVTWLLNRNVKLSASYEHAQSISGTRASYSDDTMSLGVTLGI